MDLVRIPAEEPFFEVATNYFNKLLTIDADNDWRQFFRLELERYYPNVLTFAEKDLSFAQLGVDFRIILVMVSELLKLQSKSKERKKERKK
jgi:hypothetical protein